MYINNEDLETSAKPYGFLEIGKTYQFDKKYPHCWNYSVENEPRFAKGIRNPNKIQILQGAILTVKGFEQNGPYNFDYCVCIINGRVCKFLYHKNLKQLFKEIT